jgi:hypothetical protein
MILIILGIGLIMLVVGIVLHSVSYRYADTGIRRWAYDNDGICAGIAIVGAIITLITLIFTLEFGYACSSEKAINAKIEMYQQENQYIETVVAETVKNYQDYEVQTFSKLKPQEIMVAISMYPELKSNELVAEQLKIYTSNNDTIKALKTKQIDLMTKKWWLYFGK